VCKPPLSFPSAREKFGLNVATINVCPIAFPELKPLKATKHKCRRTYAHALGDVHQISLAGKIDLAGRPALPFASSTT
jgi:hypothetical protein